MSDEPETIIDIPTLTTNDILSDIGRELGTTQVNCRMAELLNEKYIERIKSLSILNRALENRLRETILIKEELAEQIRGRKTVSARKPRSPRKLVESS